MSIEYFVEGKVITQTEGDNISLSKEDISHNSTQLVNQQGTETGVSYNTPKNIHPNDTPINTINVSLNLFFDGTQNNKTNTEAGKEYENSNHEDDSYTNDYSNVARGYDAIAPEEIDQYAIYIEGIGTENLESESIPFTTLPNNRGIPFGTGSRGVKAKVSKGCVEAGKILKMYAGQDVNLIVNVYGFSRGATAARHFLHIATNPAETLVVFKNEGVAKAPYDIPDRRIKINIDNPMLQYGYFGACLLENEVEPKSIKFNFVGLYDTVASFGINHRGGLGGIIGDDTKQLGLSAVNKSYFVLQIASDDEYRDNFDLTNISSAGVRGLEFTLPGVHSDIGGCYVYGDEEKVDIFKEIGNNGAKCEEFKKILVEEGWFEPWQLKIDERIADVPSLSTMYVLVGKRILFNTYDRISLKKMFHYSKQFNVIYLEDVIKSKHELQEDLLNRVFNILNRYTNACNDLRAKYIEEYNKSNSSGDYVEKLKGLHYEDFIDNNNPQEMEDIKTLRRQYLHWSASVTKFGLGPKVGNVTNGKERKRNIQNG